jgi:hypothetical protein
MVSSNYTPVVMLGTFLIITAWWLASARRWFKGPVIQGTETELSAIERSIGEQVIVDAAPDSTLEASAGGE